jgi:glycosyltransferase involved in cell wall biosynthesis
MLIHFVHLGDAYLPELQAYAAYVRATGHEAQVHRQIDTLPNDAAVLWWMCGQVSSDLAKRYPAAFHIHEYASTSVPPLAWLKDRVKRLRQPRPQYRIFQNDWVRQRMGFGDAVPYEFRDMGIAPEFFDVQQATAEPEFDFVYLGEMRRLQHFLPVFDGIAQAGKSVLLVGDVPADLGRQLKLHARLSVTGRVPHSDVPAQLRRARFGLNLVPNQLPYTRQTSTKLLEYCAAGLPVVSTDYVWVREFEQQHGARFACIPFHADAAAYGALLGPALEQQRCVVPDVRTLAWPRLLAGLKIWRQLGLHA